jgi:type IV pilus assembly protein PilO
MIRINLLPVAETARVAGRRQDIALGALAIGGLVLALVGAHGWQKARMFAADRSLRQVTQELQAIQGPYADVQKLEAQKSELREKLHVIGQLEAKKVGPVRILAGLSDSTPDKLWLTEYADMGGTLKLTGLGVDEQTVADFMRRLGALKFFRTVDLEGEEVRDPRPDGLRRHAAPAAARPDVAEGSPEEGRSQGGRLMFLSVLDDILERPTGQKVGALVGLVLAVAVLDWQYWYGPNQRDLADVSAQVAQKRADLDVRRSKTNARGEFERELRDLNAELKRAQARLPDQREIADLLSSVAASGRASGLEIVLFRQKPEVYHDFYADVPVEMQMRGTYHDVALFLDRVKRLDRIVNVSDINMKKPRIEGDRMMLDAACTATTFRFLDETERARILEEKKRNEGNGGPANKKAKKA